MTERQRQHSEALRGRREDIAKHWYDAIEPTIAEPDTVMMKVLLGEWTQRIITLLLAESLERDRVQAIGAALARDISAEAQVLGKTQAVLAQQLTAGLSDEQISSLQPQLIELLSELAVGFIKAKEELSKTMRGEFLSKTSHDMRSPLNAIIGFSRVVLKGIDGPITELQESDLTAVFESGQKLLEFINTIFNIERIEVGRIDFESKTFDLAEVVGAAVAAVQPMVEESSDTLDVQHAGDPGTMHSDPDKIREVLVNLLAHAAKFTRQGSITLNVARETVADGEWVRFQVTDTGLGMTPEQVERFTQAGDPRTLKYGDLGLTISQRYCQMLGGEIVVESEVGKGTTFTVRLPAQYPPNQ
jgi:signal transduction histidine kinase